VSKSADLAVGPDLRFPLDVITQSIALLAIKRAGKSNAAAVIAEEMYRAGLPWVAIDPKGDWWGLRSSGDGTGPGLPIPIFGGLHGDLPLLPEAGAVIAELIFEQNLTCILDVSEFDSKAAQMRFLTDFANRLFKLHGTDPQPRHVFLEEADEFIPQIVRAEQARCVGAWSKLVKQGGQRGLGVSIISQRSAVVNKDCLTQCDTLISLRTTSALDRKAIAEWVSYHAVARELVDSLPGLDDGEAWVVSPHWLGKSGQPAVQRRRFRRRETFDSGATPTVTRKRPAPTIADIDLGAVLDRMQTVVEKAAQADPAALRKRIAELERQARVPADSADMARLTTENRDLRAQLAAEQAMPAEQVEVPVLQPGDAAAVEQAITGLRDVAASLELALSRAAAPHTPPPARIPSARPAPKPPRGAPAPPDGDLRLRAGARNMLAVLARQHPVRITRRQLATLAKLKVTGGTFGTYFGDLRRAGLIEQDGDFVTLTAAGFAYTGTSPDLPVTAEELRETWRGSLRAGARKMLDLLIERYPDAITRSELAAMADLEQTGGTFGTYLGDLRRNGLAEETGDGIRAAEVFFLAGSTR
jgi:hypothetical protein